MKNKIEIFLKDMTYNSRFEFLEESKHKDELAEIAEKRGIVLPAHDLSVFKGRYAYVDRMNKNNCTLPKEEVKAALDTLVGKAIDFDHFRKDVVGYWIDAKIEKDEIIAYGIFFKGNFGEEYLSIKEMMEKDVLAISFEAWGDRDINENGSYSLRDIEFAGGALLIKSDPAFPGSQVLEMSKKSRVLEMAKTLTAPEHFIHIGEEDNVELEYKCIKCGYHIKKTKNLKRKKFTFKGELEKEKCEKCQADMEIVEDKKEDKVPEEARYFIHDIESIIRAVTQVECTSCNEKGYFEIDAIDFDNNKSKVTCFNCDAKLDISLTPASKLTKKGRKIQSIADIVDKAEFLKNDKFIEEFEGTDEKLSLIIENAFDNEDGITYKERLELKDDSFAIAQIVKTESGKNKKIRVLPIHDLAHVEIAKSRLGQSSSEATLNKLGISKDNVERKILRRAKQLNMKTLLEKFEKTTVEEVFQAIAKASIERELTKAELEKAYSVVDVPMSTVKADKPVLNSLNDLVGKTATGNPTSLFSAEEAEVIIKEAIVKATTKVELTDVEKAAAKVKEEAEAKVKADAKIKEDADAKIKTDAEAKKIEDAKTVEDLRADLKKVNEELASFRKAKEEAETKVKADLIASRRAEVSEFAKDVSDEHMLDDIRFENLKLKKALKDKSEGKIVNVAELVKGSSDKATTDEVKNATKRVQELAYGKQDDLKKE